VSTERSLFARFHARSVGVFVVLPLLLSACAKDAPQDGFSRGGPEGPIPRAINRVAHPAFIIAYLVVMPFVYALTLYAMAKFRRKDDDHVPAQTHGNKIVEIASVGIASALLIGLGIPATSTYFDTVEQKDDCMQISVIGHQWWWEYRYPKTGTKLETSYPRPDSKGNGGILDPDDAEAAKIEGRPQKKIFGIPRELDANGKAVPVVVNANELHIPEGCNVRLNITSMDVMHNYWVPKLAGKIYAIPGKVNHLNIEADTGLAKPGKPHFIYGQCAEFCGTSHANMRFKVVVQTKADFQKWLDGQAAPARKAQTELEKKGEELFAGGAACASCHYLEPDKGWDSTVDAAKIGPNLAHIGSRQHFAGAIAPLDEKNLTAWLRNPQAFKPGSKMVIRQLKNDEIEALVAYIKSLK
jgi:cytochrome c oxidase subunit II